MTGRPHEARVGTPLEQVVDDALDPSAPAAEKPLDIDVVGPPARIPSRWWTVAAATSLGVVVLAGAVSRPGSPVWHADETLHVWALSHRGVVDSWCARAVTWGGATSVALPALVVVGTVARSGRRGVRGRAGAGVLLGASAALGVWLGLVLNHCVDRARPPFTDWSASAGGPAFPSGHTTTATVVAGLAAWAVSDRATTRRRKIALGVGASLYAGLVGWSRFWLGVHWPSDVVGGWLLGTAWTVLVASVVTIARHGPVAAPGPEARAPAELRGAGRRCG